MTGTMTTLEGTSGLQGKGGGKLLRWPCNTTRAALASSCTHSCPEGGLARPRHRRQRCGPAVSQSAARTRTCSEIWSLLRQRKRRRQRQERAPESQERAQCGREGQSRWLPGGQAGAPGEAEPITGHTGGRTLRPQTREEAGWSSLQTRRRAVTHSASAYSPQRPRTAELPRKTPDQ